MVIVKLTESVVIAGNTRWSIAAEPTGHGHYWAAEGNFHITPNLVAEVIA